MAAHFMGASAPAKPPVARGHQSWRARDGTPVCCRASRELRFVLSLTQAGPSVHVHSLPEHRPAALRSHLLL